MLRNSRNYAVVPVCLAIVCVVSATAPSQEPDSANSHAKSLSRAFRLAAENAGPSVVTIRSKFKLNRDDRTAAMNELLQDPRFRGLFPDGLPPLPGELGFGEQVGSGVVIDKARVILTNSHVVEGADEITVRFADGSEVVAKDIETDRSSDLAILIVEFAGTPVRSPGDLQDVVEQNPIGSTQEVVVLRAGERIQRSVKMVALPDEL